jgi:acylaminoacyl-peptidase
LLLLVVQEDWGELNVGKRPPSLFVLDLKHWSLKPVKGLPQDSSVGQPEWTPDGMHILHIFFIASALT